MISSSEFTLVIAGTPMTVTFPSAGLTESFKQRYRGFLQESPAPFRVRIHWQPAGLPFEDFLMIMQYSSPPSKTNK